MTLFNNLIILKKIVIFIKIEFAFSFRDIFNVYNIIIISELLSNLFENRVFIRRNFHLRYINLVYY